MNAKSKLFTVLVLPDSAVGEPRLITRVAGNKKAQKICHGEVASKTKYEDACIGLVFEDGNGVIRYICRNDGGKAKQVVNGRVTSPRWGKKATVALLNG
jgi:hypothetical protein